MRRPYRTKRLIRRPTSVMDGMGSMMGSMMGLGLLGWVLVIALLVAIVVVFLQLLTRGGPKN